VRYGYARDLEGYLQGELVLQESETLDADEREREYLMLRLRTVRGIEPKEFEYRFRQRFEPLAALLLQCAGQGLAVEDEQGWHLTPKGFLVSNRIIGLLQDELAREKNRRLQAAARGDYRMV
ncbi:MAG: coproporphyrinogen III oxidase, partial [Oscillospiraceae bacterium]|nr:coproporphyrinogen III oxidase [Oscillospiraceae bacterium]